MNLDFKTGIYKLNQSPELTFPLVQGAITPVLTPTALPAGTGVKMVVLLLEFFQEVNGVKYLLNNGAFNVLQLVAVW